MNRFMRFMFFAAMAFTVIFVRSFIDDVSLSHSGGAANEIVAMSMAEEAIYFTVTVDVAEATSTAEIVLSPLDDFTYEFTSDGTVAVSMLAENRVEPGYERDSGIQEKYSVNTYQTDNQLRGGAAFVGGGLPYRV